MVYLDLPPNVLPVAPRDVVRAADEPDPGDDAGYPQHLLLIHGLAQEDPRNHADADIAQCRERLRETQVCLVENRHPIEELQAHDADDDNKKRLPEYGEHRQPRVGLAGQLQHRRFPEYLQRSIDQHRRSKAEDKP